MHTNSCSLVKKNFLLLCNVTRIFFCFVNVRLQCCFCCHRWCFGCMSQSSFYGLFNPMKTKLTSLLAYRFQGYFYLFKVNRCRNMLILHHYPLTFHGRVEFYLHFSAFIHIRRDIFISRYIYMLLLLATCQQPCYSRCCYCCCWLLFFCTQNSVPNMDVPIMPEEKCFNLFLFVKHSQCHMGIH